MWLRRAIVTITMGLLLLACGTSALAEGVPAPLGNVVSDYAELLSPEDAAAIDDLGEALWTDTHQPLMIVTIPGMAAFPDLPQEDVVLFSQAWFAAWDFGDPQAESRTITLFVSQQDRTARLVLGDAYSDDLRLSIQMILVESLVPDLRENRWSAGIRKTAAAMAAFGREHVGELPAYVEPTPEPEPDPAQAAPE